MSNGFERRKQQSKADIRKAAWELFGQFGVDRVSIADIARKAGVSQATIYNNFASKDALAEEFVADAVAGLVARVEAALAPDQPFDGKIAAIVSLIGELITGGQRLASGPVILAGSVDLDRDPEIRRIRDAARETMSALLLRLVADGRREGAVSPDVSDAALALYFGAFMDVFVDPQMRRRTADHPGLVDELGALMLHGLRGPI